MEGPQTIENKDNREVLWFSIVEVAKEISASHSEQRPQKAD
jgi:hypothetical protein